MPGDAGFRERLLRVAETAQATAKNQTGHGGVLGQKLFSCESAALWIKTNLRRVA